MPTIRAGELLLLAAVMALTACSVGSGSVGGVEPGQPPEQQLAPRFMVSAANPLAVDAGVNVLRNGGNALDAAVAVQMVLNVVEPAESGIGGGAFLLYRDAATGEMTVYDGREVAPAAARPDRFLWFGSFARPLALSVPTGQAVGVPGLVAMLHQAHSERGSLPWPGLIEPAIRMAEQGVPMAPRLQRQIDRDPTLRLFGDLRRTLVAARHQDPPRIVNGALADSLRVIADQGVEGFYHGPLAEAVVAAARSRWLWPGDLTLADLADYQPVKRHSVCGRYRHWTLCGLPAPSSGGITVLQILGMLEHFDLGGMEPGSAPAIHLVAEASRLAFADRFYYIGDPAFVDVPTEQLLDRDYLASRAALIRPEVALPAARPGAPGEPFMEDAPEAEELETAGTSHFTIIDGDGNVVAMTTSIEAPFGSRIMTGGFLLNNTLTDFSQHPQVAGYVMPNAVEPGKRPRSSMAPIVVLDEHEQIRLVLGSRGGSRIIGYVVKVLVGVLDWNLPVQQAIALPNFLHRDEDVGIELESGTQLAEHAGPLRQLGHKVVVVELESGTHGIERVQTGWRGGADPRMDGAARGE
ncbi:MAG: gamma-glutamyltransferase [Pseudomonadales bacterium]